jgi:hypothetical protein
MTKPERSNDVEAKITFLTTEEGGRKGPAFSGIDLSSIMIDMIGMRFILMLELKLCIQGRLSWLISVS